MPKKKAPVYKPTVTAKKVLEARYLLKDDDGKIIETPDEMFRRVARVIAAVDASYGASKAKVKKLEQAFYEAMCGLQFLPNSPTLMNAGAPLGQLSACFVLPIPDSVEGIFEALKRMAIIFKTGGGVGFSFSRLRARGTMVMSSKGEASGPISFMNIFDEANRQIKQGGKRRGAMMGMMRVDHPDIMEFVKAKLELGQLESFNISVIATDRFMTAVEMDGVYDLIDPRDNQAVGSLRAREVWDKLVHGAWKNGEPGLFFLDKVNATNPTPEVGLIESTNPCLTADTKIKTSEGEKSVGTLEGQPFMAAVHGHLYPCQEGFVPTGKKAVYKLTTGECTVTATREHKFFRTVLGPISTGCSRCRLGWVELGNLRVGDVISLGDPGAFAKITEIHGMGAEQVFSASVAGINCFVANGVLVANCGEQPLLPNESCNLASINLGNMVGKKDVNWKLLADTTAKAVHFLDNVIDANKFPVPEIEEMTLANRKVGLGIMGWAEMLICLKIQYDSEEGTELAGRVMAHIQKWAEKESERLAVERGSFPNFDRSIFKDGPPRRNATLTTIAPNGSIGIIAGANGGIEPIFTVGLYRRNILDGDQEFFSIHPLFEKMAREQGWYSEKLMKQVAQAASLQEVDDVPEEAKHLFRTAHDVSPAWHVEMQAAFQREIDNAVSKTINLPKTATEQDVDRAFRLAFSLGCKGVTVYRDGSRAAQPLATAKTDEKDKDEWKYGSLRMRDRPEVLEGRTWKLRTGCGAIFITITKDEHGHPLELFAKAGKAGVCSQVQCEAIGRLVSLALRSGIDPRETAKQLAGITCHVQFGLGERKILSCGDAIAKALLQELGPEDGDVPQAKEVEQEDGVVGQGACPDCGAALVSTGNCAYCRACGYDRCS